MSPESPVAYVLGTFPQASQTFIAREIRGLRAQGLPLLIFALRRRPADDLEAVDRAWYPEVRFAPSPISISVVSANLHYLARAPGVYLRTLISLVRLPHRPRFLALRAALLFMTAAWIARQIARHGGCRQVHAHFALAQTEVAMAVSALLGCPFSFTAHARDIYATPSALEEKIRAASVVVTCTGYNVEYLRGQCPDLPLGHVQLVHHGVDAGAAIRVAEERRVAGPQDGPPAILAAGRLIEKKGFDTLIDACGRLHQRGIRFRCRIFGSGPLMAALRTRARHRGVDELIELPGWMAADRLLEEMKSATVLAMPSRVSRVGDRDGIPNVVLEAMAAGLPVVASGVSGIPEAVSHGATGLLVAPDDPLALADALERLLTDPAHASTLGAAARQRIIEEFTLEVASDRLIALFRERTPFADVRS